MFSFTKALFPELVLVVAASILFLLGCSRKPTVRAFAPVIAVLALAIAFLSQLGQIFNAHGVSDPWQSIQISELARYVKLLTAGISILLVLLAWPGNADATEGPASHYGTETGEFFGLMLLSVTGVFLVAGANDMMVLFLGIELASLPTYIMVSISRPLPVAQEAGVKYFFLGAMAAAVMLLGFSYLYGTTGTVYLQSSIDATGTHLLGVDAVMREARLHGGITTWQMLAVVMLIAGFAFKIVAVPLHVYAADVYQGAATPLTAFISFIPKISGFVALIKVLFAAGGGSWVLPHEIWHLLWWLAVLTMTFGNVLGLLQLNIKRLFAYSSIAHSGYMLVGITALISANTTPEYQNMALRGVLFYLAAYGLTNVAAFGVLILLPGRENKPATSAETFEDIAGMDIAISLGLAMAISCFSLIGLPFTVGFVGKLMLIWPAFQSHLGSLVVILAINSAISAVYYLKIIATLFLRPIPMPPPPLANKLADTRDGIHRPGGAGRADAGHHSPRHQSDGQPSPAWNASAGRACRGPRSHRQCAHVRRWRQSLSDRVRLCPKMSASHNNPSIWPVFVQRGVLCTVHFSANIFVADVYDRTLGNLNHLLVRFYDGLTLTIVICIYRISCRLESVLSVGANHMSEEQNMLRAIVSHWSGGLQAQLLELDIAVQGPTEEQLLLEFAHAITVSYEIAVSHGEAPFASIGEPPKSIREQWRNRPLQSKTSWIELREEVAMALATALRWRKPVTSVMLEDAVAA